MLLRYQTVASALSASVGFTILNAVLMGTPGVRGSSGAAATMEPLTDAGVVRPSWLASVDTSPVTLPAVYRRTQIHSKLLAGMVFGGLMLFTSNSLAAAWQVPS